MAFGGSEWRGRSGLALLSGALVHCAHTHMDAANSSEEFDYGWTARLGGLAGESVDDLAVHQGFTTIRGSTGSDLLTLSDSGTGPQFVVDVSEQGEVASARRYVEEADAIAEFERLTGAPRRFDQRVAIPDGSGWYEVTLVDTAYATVPFCLIRTDSSDEVTWETCFGTVGDWRPQYFGKQGVLIHSNGTAIVLVKPRSQGRLVVLDAERSAETVLLESDAMEDAGAVLVGFDESGSATFARALTSTGGLDATALTENATGDVFVGGQARGASAELGSTGRTQSQDMFVLQLDPFGVPRGARVWGGAENERVDAIAFGEDGEVVAAGVFEGEVDFAPDDEEDWHEAEGVADAFVTQFRFSANDDTLLPEPPTCPSEDAALLPSNYAECTEWEDSFTEGRRCQTPIFEQELQPAEYAECVDLGGQTSFVDDHSPEHFGLWFSCWLSFDQFDCDRR